MRQSPRTVHRPARRRQQPAAVAVRQPAAALAPAAPALADAPSAAAAGSWLPGVVVLVVGSFMALLNTSSVNVAISRIQGEFGGSATQVQWISTGYTLMLGVVVPTSSWLSDRYGARRVYMVSLLVFALGSVLCGLASSLNTLILFRVVQAAGGGLLPVRAQAMIYRMVPRDRIGSAMGVYGLGIILGPAIGPTLGGWLVQDISWRLIFYVNVPIAAIGIVGVLTLLPRFADGPGRRFDLPGFVFIAGALACLLIASSDGSDPSYGWTSYTVLMLAAGGVLCLAVFVVIELSVEEPLLDIRILGGWVFSNSLALSALLQVGLFAGSFYIPLFLQQGQGLNALEAGLTLFVPALVTTVIMPLSGRLYDLIGARWLGAVGTLLVGASAYAMHALSPQTMRGPIILASCIRNAGVGLALIPVTTAGIASVSASKVGQASAINNLVGRVASALGLALLGSVLTGHQWQQLNDDGALLSAVSPGFPQLNDIAARGQSGILGLYRAVQNQGFSGGLDDLFLLTAGLCAIGVLVALLLPSGSPRRQAAAARPDPE
jgi:EmrB/QacA subfamily drug resistance transporter